MNFISSYPVSIIWEDMSNLKIVMACDAIDFMEKKCNENTKKFANPYRIILCENRFRKQAGKECQCCHYSPAIFKNRECARKALFKYIFDKHNAERLYENLDEESIKIAVNQMMQEYTMIARKK